MKHHLLGFDIGGTFTDFALLDTDTGQLRKHKRLTTPHDPAIGALDGVRVLLTRAGLTARDVHTFVHATTLVANLLIERAGARTALLTTRGFRDTLEMRSEQRYDIYDLFLRFPAPLVPRHLRLPVNERVDRDGRVLAQPTDGELDALAATLREAGVQAVAVAFLHAYRNPANEQRVAAFMRGVLPGVAVTTSSDVAPEIREYERTSTTVANAYAQPAMRAYLERLEHALQADGYEGRLYLTLSSGGNTTARTAAEYPIRLVESGPAAGAIAAAHFGARAGKRDVISFDMGGTTAKICVIDEGRPSLTHSLEVAHLQRFKKGSGIPLQFPSVDMIEIGAGGGSIARVDSLGLLKVGPHSAGSAPGPACYGMGGTLPTVTDANLVLGFLDAGYFNGGDMQLDLAAARRALAPLATHLRLSVEQAAWGVHQLVSENMAAAAKIHVVEKARDPRRYAMLAYGGGGPLHGPLVARILDCPQVICPPGAGVASAIGLMIAPRSFELAQSHPLRWDEADLDVVARVFGEMERRGRELLAEAGVTGEIRVERSADGRFVGQLHELTVPYAPSADLRASVRDAFLQHYKLRYGHLPHTGAIEFLSWRLTVSAPAPEVTFAAGDSAPHGSRTEPVSIRPAWFGTGWVDTPVYRRGDLAAGAAIAGPAIIEERESTALVHPNMRARVDDALNLVIDLRTSP